MGTVKLRNIGSGLGFIIPKKYLQDAGFDKGEEYQLFVSGGSISILKRRPPNSSWKFPDPELLNEDHEFIDGDLANLENSIYQVNTLFASYFTVISANSITDSGNVEVGVIRV